DGLQPRRTDLPTYAFQRERFWPRPKVRPVAEIVDSWRYELGWLPVGSPAVPAADGSWLVVVDPGRRADAEGLCAVLPESSVVDLPLDGRDDCWPTVAAAVAGGAAGETELAVRAGGLLARRVLRADPGTGAALPELGGGSVLVTGGTGGVGAQVVRWLTGLRP